MPLNQLNLQAGEATQQKRLGKLITFFSCKGGTGTTTVALNVAHEILRLTQYPTLILDMDQLYNNMAMRLNLQSEHGLGELSHRQPLEVDIDLLNRLIMRRPDSVDLLTCYTEQAEMIPLWLLAQTLDYLLACYQYVVVDLPSYVLDPYHQYLVERSNEFVLVSTLDLPALYRSRQYLQLVKHHVPEAALRVVLNRYNLPGAHGISNLDLEKELGHPIYQRLTDDWSLTLKAASLGVLWTQIDPRAELVRDIEKLSAQLVDLEIPTGWREPHEGIFGKIANLGFSLNTLMKGA